MSASSERKPLTGDEGSASFKPSGFLDPDRPGEVDKTTERPMDPSILSTVCSLLSSKPLTVGIEPRRDTVAPLSVRLTVPTQVYPNGLKDRGGKVSWCTTDFALELDIDRPDGFPAHELWDNADAIPWASLLKDGAHEHDTISLADNMTVQGSSKGKIRRERLGTELEGTVTLHIRCKPTHSPGPYSIQLGEETADETLGDSLKALLRSLRPFDSSLYLHQSLFNPRVLRRTEQDSTSELSRGRLSLWNASPKDGVQVNLIHDLEWTVEIPEALCGKDEDLGPHMIVTVDQKTLDNLINGLSRNLQLPCPTADKSFLLEGKEEEDRGARLLLGTKQWQGGAKVQGLLTAWGWGKEYPSQRKIDVTLNLKVSSRASALSRPGGSGGKATGDWLPGYRSIQDWVNDCIMSEGTAKENGGRKIP